MRRSSRYRDRIRRLWQDAIEPPETLHDPQLRHRVTLLNSLLVIIFPVALVVLLLQVIMAPGSIEEFSQAPSTKAVLMGIGIVLLLYIVNRTRYQRISNYLAVIIGFVAIFVDAIASDPPHLEIAYLIMLPLVGILLLSRRETLIVCIFNIVGLVAFEWLMGDIPREIIKDLITFTLLMQAFILFVTYQRDRLERDRQQLAITQANNILLKQLIANLGHDFRTPLSVINSNLYLLHRVQDTTKQQERLDQIEQQTQRLHRLIEDILAISQLDQRPDHSLQPTNLSPLLELLRWRFQTKAEARDIQIQFEWVDPLPMFPANPETLQQALAILLENALNYTEAGGRVTIRSFALSDKIVVEIQDTGIGIAETDLSAIFDPFYRVDKARSTQTGGTGLGLAIARRIIELHDGKIEVESVPGQGSTFRILLSLADKQERHRPF